MNPFKKIRSLESSLRQVSGKLAEVEAFYQAQLSASPLASVDAFDRGYEAALIAFGKVLHPESVMDSEGFVQVGDDRG